MVPNQRHSVDSQWSWVQQVERPLGLNACLLDLTALTWQALLTCTNLLVGVVVLVQTVQREGHDASRSDQRSGVCFYILWPDERN